MFEKENLITRKIKEINRASPGFGSDSLFGSDWARGSLQTYFYYGKVGHWKRNCKVYLGSKKKVACDAPLFSGIYVIRVNTVSPNNIWVYDTSCGSYIWIDM